MVNVITDITENFGGSEQKGFSPFINKFLFTSSIYILNLNPNYFWEQYFFFRSL